MERFKDPFWGSSDDPRCICAQYEYIYGDWDRRTKGKEPTDEEYFDVLCDHLCYIKKSINSLLQPGQPTVSCPVHGTPLMIQRSMMEVFKDDLEKAGEGRPASGWAPKHTQAPYSQREDRQASIASDVKDDDIDDDGDGDDDDEDEGKRPTGSKPKPSSAPDSKRTASNASSLKTAFKILEPKVSKTPGRKLSSASGSASKSNNELSRQLDTKASKVADANTSSARATRNTPETRSPAVQTGDDGPIGQGCAEAATTAHTLDRDKSQAEDKASTTTKLQAKIANEMSAVAERRRCLQDLVEQMKTRQREVDQAMADHVTRLHETIDAQYERTRKVFHDEQGKHFFHILQEMLQLDNVSSQLASLQMREKETLAKFHAGHKNVSLLHNEFHTFLAKQPSHQVFHSSVYSIDVPLGEYTEEIASGLVGFFRVSEGTDHSDQTTTLVYSEQGGPGCAQSLAKHGEEVGTSARTTVKEANTSAKVAGTPVKQSQSPVKEAKTSVKVAETPVKQVQSPVQEAKASVKVAETPVKQAQPPVKEANTSVKVAETPVNQAQSPVKEAKSSVKVTETPVKKVQSPVKEAKAAETPVKQAQSQVKDAKTSVKVAETLVKQAQSPVKEAKAAVKVAETPVRKAQSPVKEAKAAVEVAETPVKQAQSQVKEAKAAVKEAEAPVKKAQSSVQEATAAVKEAKTSVKVAEIPVKKAQSSVQKAKAAVKDAKTPVKATETPVQQAQSPVQEAKATVKEAETSVKVAETPVKKAQSPVQEAKAAMKEEKTSEKETKPPVKQAQSPVKEAKAAVTEAKTSVKVAETPLKQAQSPVKDVNTAVKEAKTSVKEAKVPVKKAETSVKPKESSGGKQAKSTGKKKKKRQARLHAYPTAAEHERWRRSWEAWWAQWRARRDPWSHQYYRQKEDFVDNTNSYVYL